jgi:hypothetical protein
MICSVLCWKLQEAAALQLIQLTPTSVGICTALWNSEISESVSAELGGEAAISTLVFVSRNRESMCFGSHHYQMGGCALPHTSRSTAATTDRSTRVN